jgi:hypothetical protein
MLLNDTITVANGTTGDDDAGNVLADNGNGTDTPNGSPVTIGLVTLTITYTSNGYKLEMYQLSIQLEP